MKIAFLTSLRTPYRILQVNEFSKIKNTDITVYYTNKQKENRNWEISMKKSFKEKDLRGMGLFGKYGYINRGLLNIIKETDIVLLGGYEQPTYIFMSLLCRMYNKPYILLFDGISSNRLDDKEHPIKKSIKSIVVKHAEAMMANGTVSKRYFNEVFHYPPEKIFNQYLTVDYAVIDQLYQEKDRIKKEYRKRLRIQETDKVLLYSGRLLDFKNVKNVIKALGKVSDERIVFLITGGGDEEEEIRRLSEQFNIRLVVTGFITSQKELFKHYFAADAFILPSYVEPWGLVVNEAMIAGLPVMISKNCGSALDLVKHTNGCLFDPYNLDQIAQVISQTLFHRDLKEMGEASREIISDWKVENSRMNLETILNHVINSENIANKNITLRKNNMKMGDF